MHGMTQTATPPSQLPKADKQRLAFVFYAAVLLEGVMLASIGPTLDALADIPGSLLAGRLYARLRGNAVLAAALVWMALLTATIPLLSSLWLLILVFTLIGLSIGLLDVGGNTLLVWLFRRDVPPYMNALHL